MGQTGLVVCVYTLSQRLRFVRAVRTHWQQKLYHAARELVWEIQGQKANRGQRG
jgi:hypothetical protein